MMYAYTENTAVA